MAKLSKEQREKLEATLSMPWGGVDLQCDGYRITLSVERAKGMSYRVGTYVNGSFHGKWMIGSESYPEQKFLRKSVRPVASKADRDRMEKAVGKRHFKKMCAEEPYWTKTITTYWMSWASGKAALNHLCKVCDAITVIEKETKELTDAVV
ncbi:hypothetical protein [Jeongeupia chitinilytica]|uniref:Uncharacterized protein n=1 Tax=Jeongeupia chitinilytica TaxID=1041641 RepID=A0ABQ3H292_9NEIS|nr:hypothetical protein [Jeongeupia chitinilytica]GHD63779.1 hypothetical protein GCM10007350_21940 [Jeongeupia chitinilytica]